MTPEARPFWEELSLNKKTFVIGAAGLALLAAGPASAHHSFAMFDSRPEARKTIEGVVKEFQWTNPHTWTQINVPNGRGGFDEWSVEGGSPNGLARRGWKRNTLRPGDKVKMVINPLKSGEKGGSFVSATFEDGRVLNAQQIPDPRPAN